MWVLVPQTVWCPSASVGSESVFSGMLVEGLLEDEELARTPLGCHLSTDLLCQEMSDAL